MPSWTDGKLVSSRPAGGGGGPGATSGDRTISASGRRGVTRVKRRAERSLGVEAGGVSPVAEAGGVPLGAGGGWAAAGDAKSAAARVSVAALNRRRQRARSASIAA